MLFTLYGSNKVLSRTTESAVDVAKYWEHKHLKWCPIIDLKKKKNKVLARIIYVLYLLRVREIVDLLTEKVVYLY